MSFAPGSPVPARPLALARSALERPGAPFLDLPPRLLVVDVASQRLTLVISGLAIAGYPVSTAAAGIGGEENSLRTPPGWHCIQDLIGEGFPSGTVFEGRVPTGAIWHGGALDQDLILTRIIRLEGLEDGVNRGAGHDSFERYIYVHGTNHEDELGRPASHGCIRMANADVIDLFDRVAVGDPLVVAGIEAPPLA